MSGLPFPPATYIKDDVALKKLVESLADEPLLAIDTESNSLHAYQERVCLIQLSTRTKDYIIDPLTVNDVSPLGELMTANQIEKVFHAAEYDIMCMKRDFGFTFHNLFDTMAAARICGYKTIGLGNMLKDLADVKVDKRHQRDDWGKRPLPEDSLHYAQIDTHYLPALRDKMRHELVEMNRLTEAAETFAEICDVPPATTNGYDPDAFWRLGLPNMLKRDELLILRELHEMRETLAKKQDKPPFKIIDNKALIALAQSAPASVRDLKAIQGISPRQAKRYGDDILAAIKRGKSTRNLPARPRPPMPEPIITDRYSALHAWRKHRAQQRGVESDVIVSKQTLWDLAVNAPECPEDLTTIRGLGPWRLATYGDEILDVIAQFERQLEE